MTTQVRERRAIAVRGIVQGVGFRPFVHSLAHGCELTGWVRNDGAGVQIEVEGSPDRLESFLRRLVEERPPLAVVEALTWEARPVGGSREFCIEESRDAEHRHALVAPDVATCPHCLRELFDPADRRYRYPFINCTNCGPRFTITLGVPYDRSRTTMAGFPMCGACRREYEDPGNRRFHAQPNACPDCGPSVQLVDGSGRELAASADALSSAAELLRRGAVLAVKGLGGYHLACDPFQARAVDALRSRKVRQDKPFALMAQDVEQARGVCRISPEEEALLEQPARPIVLVERRRDPRSPGAKVSEGVAPRQSTLGIMLAYTPLHHLLLREVGHPLVMTSGNRSDEPIAYRDDEALAQLAGIAEAFLIHNRPIHMRCDDSVVRGTSCGQGSVLSGPWDPSLPPSPSPGGEGAFPRARVSPVTSAQRHTDTPTRHGTILRRSRGYAPRPLTVREPFPRTVLACGGELKATFCLAHDRQAFVSHHIGDLENYETFRSYREAIDHYSDLFDLRPELVACDLHPEYLSTRYAEERADAGLPLVKVQHHEAHIASCLADNELSWEQWVIGVAFDGTGAGADGAIWGGEFFLGSIREGFVRKAHLEYTPLPGGAAAVREPWRMAVAHLVAVFGPEAARELPVAAVTRAGETRLRALAGMVAAGINCPLTSSAGRLFDAVAALLGLPGADRVTYEGQAAVELELAATGPAEAVYPLPLLAAGADLLIGTRDLIRAVVEEVLAGRAPGEIAARFHASLAAGITACCCRLREETGLEAVALSGGVFQNRLLTHLLTQYLVAERFTLYRHHRVPANDGGIALGQAVLAAAQAGG